MKKYITSIFLTSSLFASSNTWAGGSQDFNDCRTTLGDFCERAGSCAIQGSAWYQFVTIDKSGKFDTQGWPGLCDMVHVSLVQGNCYIDVDESIVASLSDTTYATIPSISGTLSCGGDDGGSTGGDVGGGGNNFCDTHPDHRRCQ